MGRRRRKELLTPSSLPRVAEAILRRIDTIRGVSDFQSYLCRWSNHTELASALIKRDEAWGGCARAKAEGSWWSKGWGEWGWGGGGGGA